MRELATMKLAPSRSGPDPPLALYLASLMQVALNGERREIPEGSTVENLLTLLGISGAVCAIEINKELVTRREHAAHLIRDGDAVEVVSLVGGG